MEQCPGQMTTMEKVWKREQEDSWWDNLPEPLQAFVKQATKEIDEGKSIRHAEVKKCIPVFQKAEENSS